MTNYRCNSLKAFELRSVQKNHLQELDHYMHVTTFPLEKGIEKDTYSTKPRATVKIQSQNLQKKGPERKGGKRFQMRTNFKQSASNLHVLENNAVSFRDV